MSRLTCAQSGVCQLCGSQIFRHTPRQPWYTRGKPLSTACPASPTGNHKLAPRPATSTDSVKVV